MVEAQNIDEPMIQWTRCVKSVAEYLKIVWMKAEGWQRFRATRSMLTGPEITQWGPAAWAEWAKDILRNVNSLREGQDEFTKESEKGKPERLVEDHEGS